MREPAETIHDVVVRIDAIVARSMAEGSTVGYFAALYHHVAVAFEEAVKNGTFKNPELISKLDVVFFNRYLDALEEAEAGRPVSKCWQVAFDEARAPRTITLQHLLLGMNAHIDFDLGVATADAVPADELPGFKGDFDAMNALLAGLMNPILADLARIFLPLALVNWLFRSVEDEVLGFSMIVARESAWSRAMTLSKAPEKRAVLLAEWDGESAALGRFVMNPGVIMGAVVWWVSRRERGTVRERIVWLLNKGPDPRLRTA